MDKFDKCPFCGKTAEYRDYSPGYSGSEGVFYLTHSVGCKSCNFDMVEQSKFTFKAGEIAFVHDGYTKLLTRWNRRGV